MMELRKRPYAAPLLSTFGLALGLILLRGIAGSGGQDALLAADGGLAAATAPYGVAIWLLAAAGGAWFGTPPVSRPDWWGQSGSHVRDTLGAARPALIATAMTLGLLTPIVLMAPLMTEGVSPARWLGALAVLEAGTAAGVVVGAATARFPLLGVPILAGAAGLTALLAARLALIESLVPAAPSGPLGGITAEAMARWDAMSTASPYVAAAGAAIGALLGAPALARDRSPWLLPLGAVGLPVALGGAAVLAIPVAGIGAPAGVAPLEWAALAAGGALGGLAAALLRTVTGGRSGRRHPMPIRGRAHTYGDSGQGMLEYVGLTVVATAVLAGIFISAGGYRLLPPRLEYAICQVVSGDCPVSAAEIPGTPDVNSCTVRSDLEQHVERTKVILWSEEDRESTGITEDPEGNITVTEADADASGIDVRLGVGVKINGIGLGASIGGGYLWTGEDQTQARFESDDQQREFEEEVISAQQEFIEDHGDFFDMSEEDFEELMEIPVQVAEDMGVPYSRLHADGDTASIDAEASVGFDEKDTGVEGLEAELGISAGYSQSELIGTGEHYDAEGNRTTSEYRMISDEMALDLGAAIEVQGVGPQAEISTEWDSANVMEVKYDADGNPTELTITRTSEFEIEGAAGVGYTIEPGGREHDSSQNPDGGGFLGKEASDGDVVVTTTKIPLEPGDADVMDDYINGDFEERLRAAAAIGPMADREGTVLTEQHYDSASETDGTNLSGSFVVELGAYENSTTTTTMDLEDASYRDPATGEMVPWVECEAGED